MSTDKPVQVRTHIWKLGHPDATPGAMIALESGLSLFIHQELISTVMAGLAGVRGDLAKTHPTPGTRPKEREVQPWTAYAGSAVATPGLRIVQGRKAIFVPLDEAHGLADQIVDTAEQQTITNEEN